MGKNLDETCHHLLFPQGFTKPTKGILHRPSF